MKRGNRGEIAVWAAGACSAAVSAALAVFFLSWWLNSEAAVDPELRLPVTPPEMAVLGDTGATLGGKPVDIRGDFATAGGSPSQETGSWPRFRGGDFDNISRETISLRDRWDPGGPPVLWSIDLGEGHAGAAVHNGRVYLLDYDEAQESDVLRCLSLDDGREIWRRWYRTGAKRNHGISRTVPAVSDDFVVTVGPKCHVLCADSRTGEFIWGIDLVRDYGAREPLWFTAQHPLIDGDTAVLAPGGRALMIAVDLKTGEVLWETPNPRGWQMSHSSIVPATVAGEKMYVYAALGGLTGVAAEGEEAGEVLWETGGWNHAVVAPTPVILEDGGIFVTAGYGVGSALFRVRREGGEFRIRLEQTFERKEFACEQQTPIYYGGRLYTVMPKDGGALREQLVSMTPAGELIYGSGKGNRFGLGPFVAADNKIFILNDDGLLTMARLGTDRYQPLASARVLEGRDAWAPMAVAGGRLLLRDSSRMVCLDLRFSPGARSASLGGKGKDGT